MRPIICVYYEGTDTKFGVFIKDKNQIKLLKVASVDIYGKTADNRMSLDLIESEPGIQIEGTEANATDSSESSMVFEGIINSELSDIKLHLCDFIPILTEPDIYYHVVSKKTTGSFGTTQELLVDSGDLKEKKIDRETYGVVELADGSSLTAYVRQDIGCIRMINKLAMYNGKRVYKITSVKSAEVSLVNYVSKKKKFFPDDYSLIVYIGKEYSKLIFLQGRKLKHIGSTLDIGTSNLHTYDVYFSKILLEMENGGIPTLDNIIVCGEDVSENLILSFYGTFPETNVSRVDFEEIDYSGLNDEMKSRISSFTMPIAVATEYFEEEAKTFKGLNLLPRYVKEDQKVFQFAWHGYLMIPLLFLAAFFITVRVLQNQSEISKLNKEITVQTDLKNKNLQILSAIENLNMKINNFDETQRILDSVSVGAEVWDSFFEKLCSYSARRKNYWLRNLTIDDAKLAKIEGHSLSRNVLTDLTANLDSAVLRSVNYDPIKNKDAYRFVLNLKPKK